jgi:hypothetical protein
MSLSLYGNSLSRLALASAARINGTATGLPIDMNIFNNGFRAVMFIVTTGVMTDGSVVCSVEESSVSGSGYAAVADASWRVTGTPPTVALTDDDTVFTFGVRPTKQFVHIVAVTSGATTGGIFSAVAVLHHGSFGPVNRS